jgi:AcrR family transcriptional regulator
MVTMKIREANALVTKRRIIRISRRLFLEQGYDATSVRQILQKSGLSTGTLYHFFKNKEEILLSGLHESLVDISRLTDRIAVECQEPLLRYALDVALATCEILKDKHLLNLYKAISQTASVDHAVIDIKVNKMKKLLSDLNLDFSDKEIHSRILAIHGATKALMMAAINEQIPVSPEDIYSLIINMALSEFNIPKEKIEKILLLTGKIIRDEELSSNLRKKLKA